MTDLPPDMLELKEELWPDVRFADYQAEIVESLQWNIKTTIAGANEMGKDFMLGFCNVAFALTRYPFRIVNTSAKDDHLDVLWGEIHRWVKSCKYKLDWQSGGPFIIKQREINRMYKGEQCPLSYMKSMVASQDSIAAMGGHHVPNTGDGIPRTLFCTDESSSVNDEYEEKASPWYTRGLFAGNTWPCNNFFKRQYKAGDKALRGRFRPDGTPILSSKVFIIPATMSPNVKLGMLEVRQGKQPSGRMLIPGIKSYEKFALHEEEWPEDKKCVTLYARFYEGKEVMLYPSEWLAKAMQFAMALQGRPRQAKGIGVDPGEGSADTVMTAVDELGIIEQVSKKTPDTSVIKGEILAFMIRHRVPAGRVCIDRGGGGKQIADDLRSKGHDVRTVPFGESIVKEPRRGLEQFALRKDRHEERYEYKTRRCQLFGEASELLDSSTEIGKRGFAIPHHYLELLRQLSLIPRWFDSEGRMEIPKKKRDVGEKKKDDRPTLDELMGRSPDQADSFVLAVHAMLHEGPVVRAGVT